MWDALSVFVGPTQICGEACFLYVIIKEIGIKNCDMCLCLFIYITNQFRILASTRINKHVTLNVDMHTTQGPSG